MVWITCECNAAFLQICSAPGPRVSKCAAHFHFLVNYSFKGINISHKYDVFILFNLK